MNIKLLYTAILILLGVNIYLIKKYKDLEYLSNIKVSSLINLPEEFHTYKVNIKNNMENCQKSIQELTVTDFAEKNRAIKIKEFFNQNNQYLFVCRFTDHHCEACVDDIINTLLSWSDSIGHKNMLFLSSYRNLRSFNKQRNLYGIDTLQTVNVKEQLNLPVEALNYPYYFILDSALNICSLFVPTKKNNNANNYYINLVYNYYFKNKNTDVR